MSTTPMYGPSRKASSHSASEEIPCLLWNLNVYYYFHQSLTSVPILSPMNPVLILKP